MLLLQLDAPLFITWFQCIVTIFLCWMFSLLAKMMPERISFPEFKIDIKVSREVRAYSLYCSLGRGRNVVLVCGLDCNHISYYTDSLAYITFRYGQRCIIFLWLWVEDGHFLLQILLHIFYVLRCILVKLTYKFTDSMLQYNNV